MEVIHITFDRSALELWLTKGGEIRGKLNGIGFAQTLNMEVDNAQHGGARHQSTRYPSGVAGSG